MLNPPTVPGIPGDDTILVICRDGGAAASLVQRLDAWRPATLLGALALVQ